MSCRHAKIWIRGRCKFSLAICSPTTSLGGVLGRSSFIGGTRNERRRREVGVSALLEDEVFVDAHPAVCGDSMLAHAWNNSPITIVNRPCYAQQLCHVFVRHPHSSCHCFVILIPLHVTGQSSPDSESRDSICLLRPIQCLLDASHELIT